MDTDTADRDYSDFRKPRFLTCGGGCGFADCATCYPEIRYEPEDVEEANRFDSAYFKQLAEPEQDESGAEALHRE